MLVFGAALLTAALTITHVAVQIADDWRVEKTLYTLHLLGGFVLTGVWGAGMFLLGRVPHPGVSAWAFLGFVLVLMAFAASVACSPAQGGPHVAVLAGAVFTRLAAFVCTLRAVAWLSRWRGARVSHHYARRALVAAWCVAAALALYGLLLLIDARTLGVAAGTFGVLGLVAAVVRWSALVRALGAWPELQ